MQLTVDDVRSFAGNHGKDLMIVVAWEASTNSFDVVTCGSTRDYAEAACSASKLVANALNLKTPEVQEDLRREHEVLPGEEM